MSCEYCEKDGAHRRTIQRIIQRVEYILGDACCKDVPMKSINDKLHLLAVKEKDIDCSPPCSTCSESGMEGWEMGHDV